MSRWLSLQIAGGGQNVHANPHVCDRGCRDLREIEALTFPSTSPGYALAVLGRDADRLIKVKVHPTSQSVRIRLVARQAMTRERTASINRPLTLICAIDLGNDTSVPIAEQANILAALKTEAGPILRAQ